MIIKLSVYQSTVGQLVFADYDQSEIDELEFIDTEAL